MGRDFVNVPVQGLSATFEANDTRLNVVPCSVSFWFKPRDLGARAPVSKYPPTWILQVSGQRQIYNGAWSGLVGPAPVVGQAQFFGAVINGAASAIYSQAGLLATVNAGANTGASALRMGARNDGAELYNGEVCEVAFWNAALTEPEMRALGRMVCPLNVRPAALVEYWPLYGVVDQPPEPGHKNRIHAYKSGGGDIFKTKQFAGGVHAL